MSVRRQGAPELGDPCRERTRWGRLRRGGVFRVTVITLRPFQRQFVASATDPAIDRAALSLPRGNGKSWLAGHLLTRALTPADDLYIAGTESVLCAASIEQARIVFRFARSELEPTGEYRFLDSNTRIGIVHKPTGTRLRIVGSNGKTAMGLVDCPLAVCDEPGAWETNGGQLMNDALETAQGKPGSPLRIVYIGTLAPAVSGWWHDLIDGGTHGATYVQALQGDANKWDYWPEIRRCNPLTAVSPEFRKKLLAERDAARADSRLKARFLSYRLNLPSGDESTMLLTVDDWERVTARAVGDTDGRPLVGIDLGGGRAWSAAVAIWQSGRIEAIAVCPGIPSLADQERRDRVPAGTYQRLYDGGQLRLAHGLRVQPPAALMDAVRAAWGDPALILCDRFRESDLLDCGGKARIETRVTRWSEAAADIRALRKLSADGPLSCAPESAPLIAASLSSAMVENDTSGNTRLRKRGSNNTGRDDVAAALTLVAGAYARAMDRPQKPRRVYHGAV